MSLADELLKLQQLKDSGTLSREEFERAKDKLLAEDARPVVHLLPQLPPPPPATYSLLKEVDPNFTRVADKAVNFQGVTGVIATVVFLIIASIIVCGACLIFAKVSGISSNDICDHPAVSCSN